jgi:hypothetical protein
MKSISEMTQGELAAYIDSHLRVKGINVVLSGGASVAVYSNYLYVSKDLDFVAQFNLDHTDVDSVMRELGFNSNGKYYHHSETEYFVEFISGPPAVGQDPIEGINEIEMATGVLRIITPTDSVKDRLAAFYHWGDKQSLEQAILVSKSNDINMDSVEAWSIREGKKAEFEEFLKLIKD